MKIYNYDKFPSPIDYSHGDISEFGEWELEKLGEVDELYYWYAQGAYEGMGQLIALKDGKWFMHGCGHCSCYGPTEDVDFGDNAAYDSLDELEKACSEGLLKEVKPLIDMARENHPRIKLSYDHSAQDFIIKALGLKENDTGYLVDKDGNFLASLFLEDKVKKEDIKGFVRDEGKTKALTAAHLGLMKNYLN